MIVAATAATAALAPPPCPRTFADCVDGARAALRHAREQEWRLVSIELPYLPPDVAIADRLQPQPPWPGGVAQQHRNGLRPVADESFFEATAPNSRDFEATAPNSRD